ncbi:PH domain-containing protein [Candidatus Saccharibacteria bacterium]|nr:PH domain-containing protein [Candidatus Saccharibacteria bacterium]MBR3323483.1 PH domain-containing protein [Candidatus Saccharibacteria bacterium]
MKKDLVRLRHARSTKDFPGLKLESDEYVELAIKRSPVGLILIWTGEAIGFLVMAVLLTFMMHGGEGNIVGSLPASGKSFMYFVIYVLMAATLIAGIIGSHVHRGNTLYITNHRAIQNSVDSLMSKSTNVIELSKIEDVSFNQRGLFEYVFKLGTIRMSTIGDETTYTFRLVDTPTDELEVISHLIHIEKNRIGRGRNQEEEN